MAETMGPRDEGREKGRKGERDEGTKEGWKVEDEEKGREKTVIDTGRSVNGAAGSRGLGGRGDRYSFDKY